MKRASRPAGRSPRPPSYEGKLIAALRGPLPDRRVLAARILGRLRSRAAIPTLEAIAREREDPYLAAEAARALASIDPELPAVRELARAGPALIRNAVRSAIERGPGARAARPRLHRA
jgi:HEAT repeat protein